MIIDKVLNELSKKMLGLNPPNLTFTSHSLGIKPAFPTSIIGFVCINFLDLTTTRHILFYW